MTDEPIEASGLARVEIRSLKVDTIMLLLTDTKSATVGYLLNPEALGALLGSLLGTAAQWAEKPDLGLSQFAGPRNALRASRIEIERGRIATESAVRIFAGKLELTFLIPLDDVISGLRGFIDRVDPTFGKPPH